MQRRKVDLVKEKNGIDSRIVDIQNGITEANNRAAFARATSVMNILRSTSLAQDLAARDSHRNEAAESAVRRNAIYLSEDDVTWTSSTADATLQRFQREHQAALARGVR